MNHELKGADLIAVTATLGRPTLVQRSAFAVQHLMAAAKFSRECGVVQSENAGKPLGPFYDEQIACLSATVMLAVASMESNINEHIEDLHLLIMAAPNGRYTRPWPLWKISLNGCHYRADSRTTRSI